MMTTREQSLMKPPIAIIPSFLPARTMLQRKCACGGKSGATGECDQCRQKRLQRNIESPTSETRNDFSVPPIVHEVLRSPGKPLDVETRAQAEPRFGHDFSRVRIHTDARAAESARAVDALAYTVAQDVVFGEGQFVPQSREGRKLIAHELTHVVQQQHAMPTNLQIAPAHGALEDEANSIADGAVANANRVYGVLSSSAIQRQSAPPTTEEKKKPTTAEKKKTEEKKKPATTNPKLVFNEIKTRDPSLAELITPQSIDFKSPKEPPAIKGGPVKDGEEHIWKVSVTASQGFRGSQISAGAEEKKTLKGHTQVTHPINIMWALPIMPDPEFAKQTKTEDEAFTLSAAEPLFHELLHARIMMERDPHWTNQHTQAFQDFDNLMQIANSSAVDKERQTLKQQIGAMALGAGQGKDEAVLTQDKYYEFLVHEKYDADTEGKAFGKSYSNAFIATKYSDVVALRLGVGDPAFKSIRNTLAAAAEKLFDKLDQAAKAGVPSPPTGSAPPTTK